MRRPLSLATRLTLLFAVAAAVVFPVFGWVIGDAMDDHFEEGDIAELTQIADAVERALADAGPAGGLSEAERRFDDILIGHHSASLLLAAPDGRALYRSSSGPDLSGLAGTAGERGDAVVLWNDAETTHRVLTRKAGRGSAAAGARTIVVATPIDYHLTFLASFRRTLWLMIASGIVLMSLMGWIAVRQGHAPLRKIAGRMRQVSTNERAQGIAPESVPRELSSLAVSFNEMLRRVDESFQRLANFNADIAHELRTPITNLMTQTQVAVTKARTVDEYREVLYSNIEEYERMAQMVGDMLFLAQRDADASPAEVTEIDLAAEIRALFEYYEGWAEERGVSLALDGSGTAVGDRRMLQRALGNLLSNAVRHCAAGGTVRVELEPLGGGSLRISISNPGTGIAPEHLPKLFDRFYRVDASRRRTSEGAGLGLAIVKSIVEAHGGSIAVASEQGLTTFQITLGGRPLMDQHET
jgi:two-component system heavy metal sensor histidine kinase CusS